MELLTGAIDHYCVQKIRATAVYAGLQLKVTTTASSTLTLQTAEGSITQHNAILRYLARCNQTTGLSGESEFEYAQICQWLDFLWNDIELCIAVLAGVSSGNPAYALGPEDKAKFTSETTSKINAGLKILDTHLSTRTVLVGERLTLADISFVCVVLALAKQNLLNPHAFPSLLRWFLTCAHTPRLSSAVGTNLASVFQTPTALVASTAESSGKWTRGRIRVKELLQHDTQAIGKSVVVKGWVRTSRSAQNDQLLFVELNDGSTVRGIQLVLEQGKTAGFDDVLHSGGVGASLSTQGVVVASQGKGQSIELLVSSVTVLGKVYGGENGSVGGKYYPMSGKQHSFEFLREKAHLRVRTKVFSSTMRMRHAMAFATHKFFNERGFVYTHTPLITAADAEGAGEQFAVTSLLPEHAKLTDVPKTADGHVDFSKDFFGRRCCLTVSGQLNVETHACALSDVYTFGPTFRAENSHTARHLAEFWMIEPEICFAELVDDMALAEDYVKFCTAYALEHCADDLAFLEDGFPQGEKGLRQRLKNVVDNDFAQITYSEAIVLLQSEIAAKKVKFEKYPNWGDDLGSEHERYICEKVHWL